MVALSALYMTRILGEYMNKYPRYLLNYNSMNAWRFYVVVDTRYLFVEDFIPSLKPQEYLSTEGQLHAVIFLPNSRSSLRTLSIRMQRGIEWGPVLPNRTEKYNEVRSSYTQ